SIRHYRDLHAFPTRRSSDLGSSAHRQVEVERGRARLPAQNDQRGAFRGPEREGLRVVDEVLVTAQQPACVSGQRLLGLLLLADRSEEHTSELQSPCNLVCRL